MLRHACGYKLANEGHDTRAIQAYLGHKNISHTVRYTELSPERFRDFWEEEQTTDSVTQLRALLQTAQMTACTPTKALYRTYARPSVCRRARG